MSIKVECDSCHQQFKAQDKLAGKRVKCPKCGCVIQVAQATPPEEDDGMFALAGESPAPSGTEPCPGCGRLLKPETAVCVECGFDLRKGQFLQKENEAALPTCTRCGRNLSQQDREIAGDRKICRKCRAEDIELSSVAENDVTRLVAWVPGGAATHAGCGLVALIFAIVAFAALPAAQRANGTQGEPVFGHFVVLSALVTGLALLGSAGRKLRARHLAGHTPEELSKKTVRNTTFFIKGFAGMLVVSGLMVGVAVLVDRTGSASLSSRFIIALVLGVLFCGGGALLWWRANPLTRSMERRTRAKRG